MTYDCLDPGGRERGLARATIAVQAGELVVLPTDTVYGLGCDAFSPGAVKSLLAAKGRGREMPPPVLVGHARTLDGLASDVSTEVRSLVEAFWPGALTVICRAQPSLDWDLGDTYGTVAVRMPLHPVALALLEAVGPMAVSSANLTGRPAATSSEQALIQFEGKVTVYLDGGPCEQAVPSTIVDGTRGALRVVRLGAVSVDQLREVVPGLADPVSEPATE